ncbi:hypothetical protein WIV_gp052 [Wiseana iridescent virus]|uniref:RING-type domain-containing protein n=1 Tax=Wiseana iridescent virus TaxID=68347 RepID=G0T578_IRV9|nr:hypothetical protein WIV_gp052 [Wiseana iridescent virus]ADO00395.1 hypothetical protein [Wiseana iridescent virus]
MWENKAFQDNSSRELRCENYRLGNELNNLKKKYKLVVEEKQTLERKLRMVEVKVKNEKINLPGEIERLLDNIDSIAIKNKLSDKLSSLLGCATCVVCNTQIKCVLFIGCKHLVVCVECGQKIGEKCPTCRTISEKVTLYT